MSPGARRAWTTILLEVEVPLVTKEDVIGPEGAGRHLLRALDVAGRLEKAVEAAGRGAALGEEQVDPVELAHVADPLGFEDRLATRDRKRMEGADRAARIALQVVEERRLVAVAHAFENRQVKLERLLDGVEDPAHAIGRRVDGRGAKGVLERSDEDRLVDELVLRAAEPAHLVAERRPACGRLG